MQRMILFGLATLMLVGCGRKEPLYQGLPLEVWFQRLDSDLPEVRQDALEVLAGVGEPALAAQDRITAIARRDPYNDIRIQAAKTLKVLGVSVTEFEELLKEEEEPIFPVEVGGKSAHEEREGETDFGNAASGEDDIAYLKSLIKGEGTPGDTGAATFPTDTSKAGPWKQQQFSAEFESLLKALNRPEVLKRMLDVGGEAERLFAAMKLSELKGSDAEVIEALLRADQDPDSLVRKAARKALERWRLP